MVECSDREGGGGGGGRVGGAEVCKTVFLSHLLPASPGGAGSKAPIESPPPHRRDVDDAAACSSRPDAERWHLEALEFLAGDEASDRVGCRTALRLSVGAKPNRPLKKK